MGERARITVTGRADDKRTPAGWLYDALIVAGVPFGTKQGEDPVGEPLEHFLVDNAEALERFLRPGGFRLTLAFVDVQGSMVHTVPIMGMAAPIPRLGEIIQIPPEFLEDAPEEIVTLPGGKLEPGGYVVQSVVHQLHLGEVHVLLLDARIMRKLANRMTERERRPSHP